jgi:hypothetical protein
VEQWRPNGRSGGDNGRSSILIKDSTSKGGPTESVGTGQMMEEAVIHWAQYLQCGDAQEVHKGISKRQHALTNVAMRFPRVDRAG